MYGLNAHLVFLKSRNMHVILVTWLLRPLHPRVSSLTIMTTVPLNAPCSVGNVQHVAAVARQQAKTWHNTTRQKGKVNFFLSSSVSL